MVLDAVKELSEVTDSILVSQWLRKLHSADLQESSKARFLNTNSSKTTDPILDLKAVSNTVRGPCSGKRKFRLDPK